MSKVFYLEVMDNDDVSLSNRLQLQVAILDTHGDIGVVGAYIEEINDNKKKIWTCQESNYDIEAHLMYGSYIYHPVSMIRKEILVSNNIEGHDWQRGHKMSQSKSWQ